MDRPSPIYSFQHTYIPIYIHTHYKSSIYIAYILPLIYMYIYISIYYKRTFTYIPFELLCKRPYNPWHLSKQVICYAPYISLNSHTHLYIYIYIFPHLHTCLFLQPEWWLLCKRPYKPWHPSRQSIYRAPYIPLNLHIYTYIGNKALIAPPMTQLQETSGENGSPVTQLQYNIPSQHMDASNWHFVPTVCAHLLCIYLWGIYIWVYMHVNLNICAYVFVYVL